MRGCHGCRAARSSGLRCRELGPERDV